MKRWIVPALLFLVGCGGAMKSPSLSETAPAGGGGAAPSASAEPVAGAEGEGSDVNAALAAVSYKDCGAFSSGKVQVVLAPDGTVSDVQCVGDLPKSVQACLISRFKAVKVAPFTGEPKTVFWPLQGALGAENKGVKTPE